MIRCKQCKKKYPDHLFANPLCPICNLKNRNATHGLPEGTPFQGEIASSLYDEAVAFAPPRRRSKSMNRQEHLAWAKARALEYVSIGDLPKHEAFQSRGIFIALTLGVLEVPRGPAAVRHWIEGFN